MWLENVSWWFHVLSCKKSWDRFSLKPLSRVWCGKCTVNVAWACCADREVHVKIEKNSIPIVLCNSKEIHEIIPLADELRNDEQIDGNYLTFYSTTHATQEYLDWRYLKSPFHILCDLSINIKLNN